MAAEGFAYLTPEAQARIEIDEMLARAGWAVQDSDKVSLAASRGVAVREFVLAPGHGRADYVLLAAAQETPWTTNQVNTPVFQIW